MSAWKQLVVEKLERQKASIPKEWLISCPPDDVKDVTGVPESCGLLTQKEIEITNEHVTTLLQKLASSTWTAVEVATAFCKRAIIAHQLTNCLTEIFIDRALKRAAELDEHLKSTGKVVGPLHGLPVSLKDQICIEGLETTMGYVSWIGQYAKQNAVLTDILLDAGAVLYVRTNVPQTLMWLETYNSIFGRTTNPHNRTLTCGGSSGGEGSLIALKGSPLGFGSDIGGSIRAPAAFCGLYGLRPSFHRIPYSGAVNSMYGVDSTPSVLGPLCHSIEGVKTVMKIILATKPWLKDPLVIRKPWDEEAYKLSDHGEGKKLCFAVMWDDGGAVPHPPIKRGLEMAKQALIAAGHTVVDWKPLKHPQIYANLGGIWTSAADEDFATVAAISGEPVISTMALDQEAISPDERLPSTGISAYELWQLQKARTDLREEYLRHWEGTREVTGTGRPVDAILAPVAAYTACPHGTNLYALYTAVWNSLDYPSMVIPISRVDQTLDVRAEPHTFLGKEDEAVYGMYDPAAYENAPIAFQLIGRTLEEEAVVAMSEIVDAAVAAYRK